MAALKSELSVVLTGLGRSAQRLASMEQGPLLLWFFPLSFLCFWIEPYFFEPSLTNLEGTQSTESTSAQEPLPSPRVGSPALSWPIASNDPYLVQVAKRALNSLQDISAAIERHDRDQFTESTKYAPVASIASI